MKPKKTERANLENKRGIFLQIGLLISLTLLIAAFEWSSDANYENILNKGETENFEPDVIISTRAEIPKPPPPPIPKQPDLLVIVEQIDPLKDEYFGQDVEPEPGQEIFIPQLPPEDDVPETLLPFQVNETPDFRGGGLEGFRKWCFSNIKYPNIAAENGIAGTVIVQFTVNHRGKVQDIIIMRGADPALDKEAERVISSSPDWTPGKRGIKTVNVIFTMPISFVLN